MHEVGLGNIVREFCRDRVAHFKVPRYVKFVNVLPMTVTGRAQKFRMREMMIEELGKQSVAAIATAESVACRMSQTDGTRVAAKQ